MAPTAGVAEFAADLGGAHGLAEAAGWGGGCRGGEAQGGDDAGAAGMTAEQAR
jgi:hypothetical protein